MSELSNSDRVREYYRKQGEKRERDRIIALLESLPKVGWFESAMDVKKAIRAIKGESK